MSSRPRGTSHAIDVTAFCVAYEDFVIVAIFL